MFGNVVRNTGLVGNEFLLISRYGPQDRGRTRFSSASFVIDKIIDMCSGTHSTDTRQFCVSRQT